MLLEESEVVTEGQMVGQLDKAKEVAALTAAATVEEIFAGVDIERKPCVRIPRTESDELVSNSGPADNRVTAGSVFHGTNARRANSMR